MDAAPPFRHIADPASENSPSANIPVTSSFWQSRVVAKPVVGNLALRSTVQQIDFAALRTCG
jgi:hypothetical protein